MVSGARRHRADGEARSAAASYGERRAGLEPLACLPIDVLALTAVLHRRSGNRGLSRLGKGGTIMTVFSPRELAYLSEQRLGRLATIGADGVPHVVPLGWSYNPALGTIDVTGRDLASTTKFRNAAANCKVALVVDDVLSPWRPRAVMVRGEAEALTEAADGDGGPLGAIIRIHPTHVTSWGLEPGTA